MVPKRLSRRPWRIGSQGCQSIGRRRNPVRERPSSHASWLIPSERGLTVSGPGSRKTLSPRCTRPRSTTQVYVLCACDIGREFRAQLIGGGYTEKTVSDRGIFRGVTHLRFRQ